MQITAIKKSVKMDGTKVNSITTAGMWLGKQLQLHIYQSSFLNCTNGGPY